ncbi:two-component system sensor histidine kinase NtrB [Arenicella xantha]|uniref:histidine kinase n=1 Tax=Arenicella xantha TaxID=644221 RepID=A0A395JNG2_9GAMM|nr:ATP-binding protein [Arenicella xantha]RBP51114.1 two-component system sensor kinase FixL [Arenicella xantha]
MNSQNNSFWNTFVPSGENYLWRSDILWLNVIADGVIALALLFIAFTFYTVVRKQPQSPYRARLTLFLWFTLVASVTHMVAVWTVWHGDYGVQGLSKSIAAIIAIATAVAVGARMPVMMSGKRVRELETLNQKLQFQIEAQEVATDNLINAEQQMRQFLQQAPDGLLIVEPSGRIEYTNDMLNAMFGRPPGDLNNQSILEILPERSRGLISPFHNDLYSTELAHSEQGGAEFIGMRKDGTEFPVEIRLRPIYSRERGSRLTVLATLRDLTDRKETEESTRKNLEELAHVSRLNTVGQMAAGLAHELNQPLTAITSNLHTAMSIQRSKKKPDPILMEMMEENYNSALRAGQIIKSLRRLVRKKEGEKYPTNINDLITLSQNFIGAEAKAAGVEIVSLLDELLPRTLTDAVQLQQVMVNLMRNAIEELSHSGKDNPVISIGTSIDSHGLICVSVADNGPGMTEAVRESLFQPYITSKDGGMGLGLPICRTIVESHGGELWLDSNYVEGSRFLFTIAITTTPEEAS